MSDELLQALESRSWVQTTVTLDDNSVPVWIRKVTALEYLSIVGCAFAAYPEPPPAPIPAGREHQQPVPDDTPVSRESNVTTARRRLQIAEGIVMLGVVKGHGSHEAVLTEQTVGQLKDVELNEIATAIMRISGIGEEDQAAAEHFPDTSERGADPGDDG